MEVMVGIGLAGALVLMVLLLGTTALTTDAKASDRQIAAAVAESQLDLISRQVTMQNSPERAAFWVAPDGVYGGPGVMPSLTSNGTEYTLEYTLTTLRHPSGELAGGPDNRLRQLNLVVSWWQGEKGRTGYGQFTVYRTRVLRESDVRS
jgi:hypothetical protein